MSVTITNAARFTCDYEACGVPELTEAKDANRAPLPDGWYEVFVPKADRLVFNSEECLVRFIRSLNTERRDGAGIEVATARNHLDAALEPVA